MRDFETVRIRGQEFAVVECGSCGVVFVVPLVVHQAHYERGGFAHCSNGHGWGWKTGHVEQEALRHERDQLKQETAKNAGAGLLPAGVEVS